MKTRNLRGMTIEELESLQVDEKTNELYWKGSPVKTKEKIELNWAVNLSIILTGLATTAIAAVEILNLLKH